MNLAAILALVATLALGIAAGLLYLQRIRKPLVVRAHLILALAATALVLLLTVTAPAAQSGPPRALPLLLVGLAAAAGWSAFRYARRGAKLVLALHAVVGVASFLVFIAWIRSA
jgi:peptidoglycan/LPS O-acetylase OafA/YrhL